MLKQKKPSIRLLIWPLNTIIRGDFARYTPSLASYYWFVEENYPETFKALEEALKISEEAKDIVTLVLASYWFGCALGWNCEFERSTNYFQRALDINMAVKNLWGIATMKSNLAYFSYCHQWKNKFAIRELPKRLSALPKRAGIFIPKAMAYVTHGISCYGKGLLEEAEKYLLKGLEFCEKINFPAWNGACTISPWRDLF